MQSSELMRQDYGAANCKPAWSMRRSWTNGRKRRGAAGCHDAAPHHLTGCMTKQPVNGLAGGMERNLFTKVYMFDRFRIWAATKIAGNRLNVLGTVGAQCIHKVMLFTGMTYTDWQMTSGHSYVLTQGTARRKCLDNGHDEMICDVCRHVFDCHPDRPARCPNCSSHSTSFA